jgi:hypothetical protein
MAHKLARHGAERLSGAKVTQFLVFLLGTLGLDLGVSSSALQLLLTLPNSRANESEADKIGWASDHYHATTADIRAGFGWRTGMLRSIRSNTSVGAYAREEPWRRRWCNAGHAQHASG